MKRNKVKMPLLEVDGVYFIGGKSIKVKESDGTGCNKCVFENNCARFAVETILPSYHTFCGAFFRTDKKSVFFEEFKPGK